MTNDKGKRGPKITFGQRGADELIESHIEAAEAEDRAFKSRCWTAVQGIRCARLEHHEGPHYFDHEHPEVWEGSPTPARELAPDGKEWMTRKEAHDLLCTCPGRCVLHNAQDPPAPGQLRGESVFAPLKRELDKAREVAPDPPSLESQGFRMVDAEKGVIEKLGEAKDGRCGQVMELRGACQLPAGHDGMHAWLGDALPAREVAPEAPGASAMCWKLHGQGTPQLWRCDLETGHEGPCSNRKAEEVAPGKVDPRTVSVPMIGLGPLLSQPYVDPTAEFVSETPSLGVFVEGRPLSDAQLDGAHIIDENGKDLGLVTGFVFYPAQGVVTYGNFSAWWEFWFGRSPSDLKFDLEELKNWTQHAFDDAVRIKKLQRRS